MATTIEAKLRISAIVDQAVKALREVKREAEEVNQAANPNAPAFDGLGAGAAEATTKISKTKRELKELDEAAKVSAAARKKEAADAKADAKKQADEEKAAAKVKKAAADDAAKAVRQQANQARQLGPQVTDIVTGLATGQNPFTVLLQQGGQLKDVFGGVGNAGKALMSIFTPMKLLVGALAGAFGLFAFEAFKGRTESEALQRSITISGNVAGTTAGQIGRLAKEITDAQKVPIAGVRETLALLVDTGTFTGSTLGVAGKAATAFSKVTGKTAAETLGTFAEMSNGVAEWAVKYNKAYNFISADQISYVRRLESEGRQQEAMRFTLEQLSGTMEQRAAPALGTLQRLWNGIATKVSEASDALKSIGRDSDPEERIAELTKRLKDLDELRNRKVAAGVSAGPLRTLDQQIAGVQAELKQRRDAANTEARDATERSLALQRENETNRERSKANQDALAQLDAASSQRILQQQLAALDARQNAADRAFDRGLTSAIDHNVALNKVDEDRLVAQESSLKRQLSIEQRRAEMTKTTPEEAKANQARIVEIQNQLIEVRTRVNQAASRGRGLVEADTLAEARDKAQKWAEVWQQAEGQVRQLTQQNAAASAAQIADPMARATAEAANKIAELRRQLSDLRRDLELRLSLTVDPAQRAALIEQLQQLGVQSQKAIDEQTRAGQFASFQAQAAELQQALQIQEQRINDAVEQGTTTAVEGEQQKFAERAKSIPQLERILALMKGLAATQGEKNAVEQLVNDIGKAKDATTELGKAARSSATSGLAQFFNDIETGAKSGKGALLDMVGSFAKAMLNLLNQRLAEQLINQFAGAAGSSGGGAGGFFSAAGSWFASLFHTGGVLGQSSGSGTRSVSAALFAGAPRYHGGGILGLEPGEMPLIGKVGEEMLTEDDPRHIKNFKGSFGGVQMNAQISFVDTGGSNETDKRAGAAELLQMMQNTIETWAGRESRQGGKLDRSRSGS